MVNHARTLLCNVNGSDRPQIGILGEEYIPSDFVSVDLPQSVLTLRRILFGTDPDSVYMNYRAAECMRILHSTEFRDYLTDLDSRVTYNLSDEVFYDTAWGSAIQNLSNSEILQLSILGLPSADDYAGRSRYVWDIRITPQDSVFITSSNRSSAYVLEVDGSGVSPDYEMPGGKQLNLRIIQQAEGSPEGFWRVTALCKPSSIALTEERLRTAGQETFMNLFDGSEPYTTFKNLWQQHSLFKYRLSGLLLAMIYRTEERRLASA